MPFARPNDEMNILADMMHYSGTPFSADKASIICMDLQIDAGFAPFIREHMKFFKSAERRKKLISSDFDMDTEDRICRAMIAVTLGCRNSDFSSILEEVLKRYATEPTPEKSAEIFDKLEDYGLKTSFWIMCSGEYGTPTPDSDQMPTLGSLIRTFFISYLANTVELNKSRLESMISKKKGRIFTFINGMYNDRNYSESVEKLSENVAEAVKIRQYLDTMDTEQFAESDAFACIDEIIIERLISQIVSTSRPLDSNDVKLISSRLKLHYGRRFESEYKLIESGTMLLEKSDEFFRKIQFINDTKTLLDNYAQNWYKIDRYYRTFICHSDEINQKTDSMDRFIELVENTYNNRFLDIITEKLCLLTGTYSDLPDPYQTSFYNRYVKGTDRATVVIISDALRYECVTELRDDLDTTSRISDLKLEYVVSVLPSITKFGMAALLPNDGLDVSHDGKFNISINGMSTASAEDREKILTSANKDSVRISFKDVITFKQSELRAKCAGKKIIYIYHDTVDATGDKPAGEINTFKACSEAISQIKNMIDTITNKLSYTKFIITADHGFIYRRRVIEEADKTVVSNNIDADKRYALTDKSNGMINSNEYSLSYLGASNEGLFVSVPSDSRIFRVPGAGQNFVHGGLSPQEIVVPVLTVTANKGKVTEEYVGITPPVKREIKKLKQSFDFLQTNPVNDKYRKAEYEIYFTNEDDVKISNTCKAVADRKDGEDQWMNISFSISGIKKGRAYLHINNLTNPDEEPVKVEFTVNILFTMEGI